MKKIILLFIIVSSKLNAQYIPIVEENKFWIYHDHQSRVRPTNGYIVYFHGDTLINNLIYKNVMRFDIEGEMQNMNGSPPAFVHDFPYKTFNQKKIGFIREDVLERKVFMIPLKQPECVDSLRQINNCNDVIFCSDEEHLLFDFSLKENDTLNYCSYEPLHYNWEIQPEFVDSIKSEIIENKLRRTFYTYGVSGYLNPPIGMPGPIAPGIVKIAEGIGFLNAGIFNYRFGILVDYCEGTFSDCNIIISSTKDNLFLNTEFALIPNPSNDFLDVKTNRKIEEVSIIDLNGSILYQFQGKNTIPISSLIHGIYFLQVKFQNGETLAKKFIKN